MNPATAAASSRQPVVFSAPNFPLPMETATSAAAGSDSSSSSSSVSLDDLMCTGDGGGSDNDDIFDQFFSTLPWQQQSAAAADGGRGGGGVSTVVKQEKETGFFDQWSHHQNQHQQAMDPFSPEDEKRCESSLIREELSCRLQLKMIKEGKEFSAEVDDQPASRDYPLSEATLQLQRDRREKNREAAKKCRQKKRATEKQLEQKVRENELAMRKMRQQLDQSTQDYSSLLNSFQGWPCFIAYLRLHREVLRSPRLKAELQRFVKTSGGQLSGSIGCGGGGGGGGGGVGSQCCGLEPSTSLQAAVAESRVEP